MKKKKCTKADEKRMLRKFAFKDRIKKNRRCFARSRKFSV